LDRGALDTCSGLKSASTASPTATIAVVDLGGRTLMPGMITCHFPTRRTTELGPSPPPLTASDNPPGYLALRAAHNLETALRLRASPGAGQRRCARTVIDAGDEARAIKKSPTGLVPGRASSPVSRGSLDRPAHANDSNAVVRGICALRPPLRLLRTEPDEFRSRRACDEIKRGADIIKPVRLRLAHGTTAADSTRR
jgi:hypothetical protein